MNHTKETSRQAAERALALVGFVALVIFGIWLAIYSSRFVPAAVERLGGAAVVLSSIFTPHSGGISVVPTGGSTTTLPFPGDEGSGTSTPSTGTPATGGTSGTPTAGSPSSGIYPIGSGSATSSAPYGLPDLTVSITNVGYLASSSADSFVTSGTVSAATRPAVKFIIRNAGTNVVPTGWIFSAAIPSQSGYVFASMPQQALYPGDSIEYTLGFDQATPGVNRSISINADSTAFVNESNETNNSATASITITNP